jgi:hypothetical protein
MMPLARELKSSIVPSAKPSPVASYLAQQNTISMPAVVPPAKSSPSAAPPRSSATAAPAAATPAAVPTPAFMPPLPPLLSTLPLPAAIQNPPPVPPPAPTPQPSNVISSASESSAYSPSSPCSSEAGEMGDQPRPVPPQPASSGSPTTVPAVPPAATPKQLSKKERKALARAGKGPSPGGKLNRAQKRAQKVAADKASKLAASAAHQSRGPPVCLNCDGPHATYTCPLPHDAPRVKEAKLRRKQARRESRQSDVMTSPIPDSFSSPHPPPYSSLPDAKRPRLDGAPPRAGGIASTAPFWDPPDRLHTAEASAQGNGSMGQAPASLTRPLVHNGRTLLVQPARPCADCTARAAAQRQVLPVLVAGRSFVALQENAAGTLPSEACLVVLCPLRVPFACLLDLISPFGRVDGCEYSLAPDKPTWLQSAAVLYVCLQRP